MTATLSEFDLLREVFVPEMRDLIEVASDALLVLESDPADKAAIDDLFRVVHTIKGTSGMCDLPILVEMVHSAEDLLDEVRYGAIDLQPEIVDDLLSCFDQITVWTDSLEATGALPADSATIARERSDRYKFWLQGLAPQSPAEPAGPRPEAMPDWFDEGLRSVCEWFTAPGAERHLIRFQPAAECYYTGSDPLTVLRAVPDCLWHAAVPLAPWNRSEVFDPFASNLVFYAISTAPACDLEMILEKVRSQISLFALTAEGLSAELRAPTLDDDIDGFELFFDSPPPVDPGQGPRAEAAPALAPAGPPAAEPRGAQDRALKVEPSKIDALVNLLGELVVAKNGLPFVAQRAEQAFHNRELSREIRDNYAVIDRIARELQTAVMAIRMLPVSEMFKRFPRLVRDVSRKLGKSVELVIEGETTEADKSAIEALAEPLVHILRNSLDHGIESPEERRAAGKPQVARIVLRASQQGDRVLITITDDGRGIDADRMRQSALAKGLISEARADSMSDAEAIDLIFLPGFSTAAEVSDLSGRGVGMDAVRHVLQSLGGSVAIDSKVAQGTTVTLSLPLTMAVTRVLTVEAEGQLFGIPLEDIDQTLRIAASDIRRVKSAEAFVLRDAVVPLIRLRKVLCLPDGPSRAEEAVLILRHAGAVIGLVVDAFHSGMEIILKPMTHLLNGLSGYSGTAVLGDGKVLLVLNTRELV